MGEERKFYSENLTMVLWNMDDYPIPAAGVEDDLGFIRTNIEEVGHRIGFHGPKEIDVYCKRIKSDVDEELSKAGIFYIPPLTTIPDAAAAGVNKPAPLDMTSLLVQSALSVTGPLGTPDLVVIAKPLRELDRVIKCLHSRGHAVLLIDPTAITGSFFSVESLLGCARFLRPPPRPPTRTEFFSSRLPNDFSHEDYLAVEKAFKDLFPDVEEEEEDTSKVVDFYEPTRPKEHRTGVFWDGEDFPLPPFSTPDEIYAKIESALLKRNVTYKLSIYVYLDDNKKGTWRDALLGGGKKEWASRIYFLPGGDKASRRIGMANDITFWAKDDSPCDDIFEGILILFSDQFKDDVEYTEMLKDLVGCGCYCVLSVTTPTHGINNIPGTDPEWPRLLIDGGHWVGNVPAYGTSIS